MNKGPDGPTMVSGLSVLADQRISDADMPRAFAIISKAFGHDHEYIEAVFPAHATDYGRAVLELFL